jgi:hypothetical protein
MIRVGSIGSDQAFAKRFGDGLGLRVDLKLFVELANEPRSS